MEKVEHTKTSLLDQSLLDKVDKLFACGVGSHVALPQLVVVGDQSSGKSSVLEGLTRLPFPRDSTLCTRFGTQVTFRRSFQKNVTITILPSRDGSSRNKELQAYKREAVSLTPGLFEEIMTEVRALMGIDAQDVSGTRTSFTDHVLKIEVCGPDEEHLSVIDVPGIFEKATEGVTTKLDIALVKSMVERYMQNPRSVMLVVVPANVDIATQKILTMAEEADPDGHRTLGVLTKPDLVDKGAEHNVMDLLSNKSHKLTLGWCIVCNPGQHQLQKNDFDRNGHEKLFFQANVPWNSLKKDRVGIEALRIQLRDICAGHIRREFPKVKIEIGKKLADSKKALSQLGEKRDSPESQRQYLLKFCMEFQEVTTFALTANYNASKVFDGNPDLRLATAVISRSELLSKAVKTFGHLHPFEGEHHAGSEDNAESESSSVSGEELDSKPALREFHTVETHPDLYDMAHELKFKESNPSSPTMNWLTRVYKESRGFEIGTFDGSLLATTMKDQSSNWKGFALGYIDDIINLVHGYITSLLRIVCAGDTRAYDGLLSLLMDTLLERYKAAVDHVNFILHVECDGTPATQNHYLNSNLEMNRQKRLRDALMPRSVELHRQDLGPPQQPPAVSGELESEDFIEYWNAIPKHKISKAKKAIKRSSVSAEAQKYVRLDDILMNQNLSNTEHIVQELHDILKAYYKVARKRFVDNLHMQSTDYHLLTGHKSPLKLFNASYVGGLSEEQLEEIAGEDTTLKRQRESLEKEVSDLEKGKKILR